MLITSGTSSAYEWVFRGIQIYLIIGFIFAERTRWPRESKLVILRLSGSAGSRSLGLWADLIGGTARFRTVRGGRRWRRASTRWFIINASRRPPDIIFTLSLSRHSAAGVKKAWAPDTRILQEGQCRGQSESDAQYDTVTTQTHISFNELLLTSHTVCAATRSQKEWISKGRWVKTWIYSDLVSRSQISSQLYILTLVGQAGKKASSKARGWMRISSIVPNLIH